MVRRHVVLPSAVVMGAPLWVFQQVSVARPKALALQAQEAIDRAVEPVFLRVSNIRADDPLNRWQ